MFLPHISLLLPPQSSSPHKPLPRKCSMSASTADMGATLPMLHIGLIKTYESIIAPLNVSFLICIMGLIKMFIPSILTKCLLAQKALKYIVINYCCKAADRRAHSNLVALFVPLVLARNTISHWQTTHQKTRDSQSLQDAKATFAMNNLW